MKAPASFPPEYWARQAEEIARREADKQKITADMQRIIDITMGKDRKSLEEAAADANVPLANALAWQKENYWFYLCTD